MFILIALLLFLGTSLFTVLTWVHFTGLDGWAWVAVPLIGVTGFVATIFVSFRWRHVLLRLTGTLTAVAIGFLNFALLAAIACWLAFGLTRAIGAKPDLRAAAMILYGGGVLVAIYGLVNAARLRVTRVTVRLRNLPAAWQGREVALVSDVHIGNVRGPAFVRRVVQRLNRLEPAAVLIAGDMFDGAKVDLAASTRPWADLRAPAGSYFVSGNHDEFSERAPYLAALREVGVRVLDNEKVTVEGLQIVGVHDRETHQPAVFRQILDRAGLDRNRASILIAHQPRNLKIAEEAGIALQVSGHTHAGQFWPWTLLVRRIYGPFAYGLNRLGRLQVFTSSGAGSWGPPVRVGSRAEIVMLRLEAEP